MNGLVSALKARFSAIPEGSGALFFIQIFATLGFAVLYSTLVLYGTKHLGMTAKDATALMGVFGAFNYGLHLFGGYLGGRFLSNRNLFVGGMVLQVIGCGTISLGTSAAFYAGLALFLTGSGLNVTCINMMLTQRFTPDDPRRESAFLWNYAGMNIGFFVGFTGAGYFQATESYSQLFIFATVGNFIAIILALATWKSIRDLNTPLLEATRKAFNTRLAIGVAILLGTIPVVAIGLKFTSITAMLTVGISVVIAIALIVLTAIHEVKNEQKRMWAYLILTVGSLGFWSLYQMAPSGLQLFAEHNVDLIVYGVKVQPQWIQNINTVVIVIGGPIMAALFTRLRARGWNIDVPRQFAASLLLMGVAFLILPIGISMADSTGKSAFVWLGGSYVLQSVGELLISPVGYAMIGKLAPKKHQGVMMGSWMFVTGLASIFAGWFSGLVPEPTGTTAVETNAAYASLFGRLGWGSVAVAVALMALVPVLRKLIGDKQEAPAPAPVASPTA